MLRLQSASESSTVAISNLPRLCYLWFDWLIWKRKFMDELSFIVEHEVRIKYLYDNLFDLYRIFEDVNLSFYIWMKYTYTILAYCKYIIRRESEFVLFKKKICKPKKKPHKTNQNQNKTYICWKNTCKHIYIYKDENIIQLGLWT